MYEHTALRYASCVELKSHGVLYATPNTLSRSSLWIRAWRLAVCSHVHGAQMPFAVSFLARAHYCSGFFSLVVLPCIYVHGTGQHRRSV